MEKNIPGDTTQKIVSAFLDHHRYATLGSLVNGIIHNLNGSLQILSMHMELLQRMLEGGMDRGHVLSRMEQCLKQVDKLKSIIEGLAVKARHDEEDSPQIFDPNQLLEECLSLLRHNLFFKHNVSVTRAFSSQVPSLRGHYSDFLEGFLSLLNNAIEAMEETSKRELALTTKRDNGCVVVLIHDTGSGISDDVKPFLFKPFFTTKRGKHNGLGLFISKELLTPYGATFDYTSGREGTTFSVSFPLNSFSSF